MKTYLFIFFAFNGGAFAQDLQNQVETEQLRPRVFSPAEVQKINDTQFIFVDGIFGDYLRANFKPALHFLSANSFQSETVILQPKTKNEIGVNAEINYEKIKLYRAMSAKQNWVLIAHSKGAAETLLAVLRHPEWFKTLGVSAIVLVSAPVSGTDAVDFFSKDCNQAPIPLCRTVNRRWPVFNSLLPATMKMLVSRAIEKLSREDKTWIESKLFYVRTQMSDLDLVSPLYAMHAYLSLAHPGQGPNDGLIPTQNQLLYEQGFEETNGGAVFGTDLGVMKSDHNALLNATPFAKTETFREAFFKTLLARVLVYY